MPNVSATAAPNTPLLDLIDQCVMCGLCTPVCPTYRLEAVEAEAPRGRIALARALATGALAPSPAALRHLDHCLGCLSCQKVCPSQVRYDDILVATRAGATVAHAAAGSRKTTLAGRVLDDPVRLTRLARLGAGVRAGRWLPSLARLLPRASAWRRLAAAQPDLPRPLQPGVRVSAPASTATRGTIALFRGCVASVYDRDTLAAAQILLEALGYTVVRTAGTPCCGSLARHRGDLPAAAAQAVAARAALRATRAPIVLASASGCFKDLRDQVLGRDDAQDVDVLAFITRDTRLASLRFRPLAARAALHLPCSQVNGPGNSAHVAALLARIPRLEVLALPDQPRCCGGAGRYFLDQPEFAGRLRAERLDQATALRPDVLLTTNIGCRIHLGNGLRERDAALPVRHPLALLAEQLETDVP